VPAVKLIKRKELIHYLKKLDFEGPYSGGKHQFMIKEKLTLTIPNPHKSEISKELLIRILKQAKIEISVWEKI
jgi:predicted RNA binding protein YcfA (HicA-like mRNA interferase family)